MQRLIDQRGRPALGWLREPVESVNYRDYDLRNAMDRRRSAWFRHMAYNQFQFIGIPGPDWTAGVAIVNLKWLSNAFFYVYDRRANELLEVSRLQPLALGTTFSDSPDRGEASFRQGKTQLHIAPEAGKRAISLTHGDEVEWSLLVDVPDPDQALRVCSPAGYTGWSYTQKGAGLGVTGHIRWQDRFFEPAPDQRASIDWSAGFMRRETAWNWACLAGKSGGRTIGLNLATGVNESGITENAYWLDGQLHKVDFAQFRFDRYDPHAHWQVYSLDGQIDLRFEPDGYRSERTNAMVIASNFRQFYGRFHGRIETPSGESIVVDGIPGFMEDHYARW